MAALRCEICGGKLIGKPSGIFECDSCGIEYSTEWAKQKIQEIRGTVQVEGTVEVQGAVKIDGPVKVEGGVNAESLLKRGEMALEDRKWDEAADFFNQVLNYDAENCRAYLGLTRVDLHCATLDALKDTYLTWPGNCKTNRNFQRVMQFSDAELSALITGWDSERPTWLERKRQTIFQARSRISTPKGMICTGLWLKVISPERHIVGLYKDGSVTAAGDNSFGQCDIGGWHDIVAVSSAGEHTVGLRSDGTVVAVGKNQFGQCDVGDWRNIIAVSAGFQNTAGLRGDGTVVIVGNNESDQCAVQDWTDIIEVSICAIHTVGLRSDGTVVAVGNNENGRCDVSEWRDIVAISAGTCHTVGLRADGTVVAVGSNKFGQCDVAQWRDIISVSATGLHTVGLKRDGTVVAVGLDQFGENQIDDWENIVAISAGGYQTMGLKSDGSVVIAHKGAVPPQWNLFNRSMEILEAEKAALMAELPTLTGLFSGGRRKRVEARLAEIEAELNKLKGGTYERE